MTNKEHHNFKSSVQVDTSHYNFTDYVQFGRWASYWHQIYETMTLVPKTVLIIGAGDNIVKDILTKQGIQVFTFDIDTTLNPDFMGDIINIDTILAGKRFDVVLCCQVLEHIPYEMFLQVLPKLKAIATNVIISLPYSAIYYKMHLKLPIIKTIKLDIKIHQFYKKQKFNGEHYWEIGKRHYPKRKVTKDIKRFFLIKKRFLSTNNDYHLFFVLKS